MLKSKKVFVGEPCRDQHGSIPTSGDDDFVRHRLRQRRQGEMIILDEAVRHKIFWYLGKGSRGRIEPYEISELQVLTDALG